jgi:hypothetical protein
MSWSDTYKNLEPAWSEPSESIMHLSLEQKISTYLDGIRKKQFKTKYTVYWNPSLVYI